MSDTPESRLVVLAFDDDMLASELLMSVARLADQGTLELDDAVLVHRDEESGKVRVEQTLDMSAGKGAVATGFWGVVVGTILLGPLAGLAAGAVAAGGGALIGKLVDVGVPESFVQDVKGAVPPGSTALVLLTRIIDEDAWEQELTRYPSARPLSTVVPAGAHEALAEVEPHEDVEPPRR